MENTRTIRIAIVAAALLIGLSAFEAALSGAAYAAVKNGKVKKGGYLYYYRNGRKVTNGTVKISGKNYYFSAKGRGFLSLKNKKGNKAMSKVIDNVRFKEGYTKRQKMNACYRYIVKMTYMVEPAPDTAASGWYYAAAKKMADSKAGKCYGFASLTAVAARAMGYGKVQVHHGEVKSQQDKTWLEHCWVTVNGKVLDGSYDGSNWTRSGKPSSWTLRYFFKTYDAIKKYDGRWGVSYKDGDIYTLK